MAWSWNFFIFLAVLLAGSLWCGYVVTERMLGREAAYKNLRYNIPWLLFGFILAAMIPLFGRYGWLSFYILSYGSWGVLLISWFFKKQKTGTLLIDVGMTSQDKFIFWIASITVAAAVFQTGKFFVIGSNGVPKYANLGLAISQLVGVWSVPSFVVAIGLNKLEFREKGICFMYSQITWQEISSYEWDQAKPNVLTIRFKPQFLLLPGFMSMTIPEKHRDAIGHILDKQLPGKNLAIDQTR